MFRDFGWVSRIDIALDVADNIFELDYFIKSLKRWNLLVKRRFNVISEKDGLVILSVNCLP